MLVFIYLFIFYKNILQPLTVPAFNGGFLHEYKVALTLTFVFVCLAWKTFHRWLNFSQIILNVNILFLCFEKKKCGLNKKTFLDASTDAPFFFAAQANEATREHGSCVVNKAALVPPTGTALIPSQYDIISVCNIGREEAPPSQDGGFSCSAQTSVSCSPCCCYFFMINIDILFSLAKTLVGNPPPLCFPLTLSVEKLLSHFDHWLSLPDHRGRETHTPVSDNILCCVCCLFLYILIILKK